MHEYVTVSASSYDPASLAAKLNEKSAQGWDVVAIVPTGGDVTAFLRRASRASDNGGAPEEAVSTSVWDAGSSSAQVTTEPVVTAAPEPQPTSEPAGWAVAPESSAPAAADQPAAAAPTTVIQSTTPYQAATPEASASPAVPAGWYADPAGRFDLRYWDGGQWTEHVARGGQQYTDPPVA